MPARALASFTALLGFAVACQATDDPGSGPGVPVASGGAVAAGGTEAAGGLAQPPGSGGSPAVASGGAASPASGGAGTGGQAPADAAVAPECEPFVMPADCMVPEGAVLPGELRCTGLYGNWAERQLACGVSEYAPAHALWSDGSEKHRYVSLPPGQTIDVSDPDNFVYPVGTQFWKEFRVGDQRQGETRLMRKTDLGWLYTAFVWTEDGTNAIQANDGVDDLFGTGHTVPTREQCRDCHSGRPDFILGWDFVLLGAGAQGVTRETLADAGILANVDAAQAALQSQIPGDEVERAALAYLHVNCGVSCHNSTPEALGRLSGLLLRLDTDQLGSVLETDAVTTGINRQPGANVELEGLAEPPGPFYDFRPLDPERSLAVAKMNIRGGTLAPMPPIASNDVDAVGVAAIIAWVNQMTTERGYPAADP